MEGRHPTCSRGPMDLRRSTSPDEPTPLRPFAREWGVCIYPLGGFAGTGEPPCPNTKPWRRTSSEGPAHSAKRERDRRDVEPRAPDRDGGRLSGPGRRGPPVALVRGRGYLLEVRHHSPRVETWTGRKPRMEGDVGSRRLRLHSRPRGHHENPRGGEEIQRRDRVQRRMVPPREAEPTARRPTGPRVRHGGPRPFVRVRRAGVAGDGA